MKIKMTLLGILIFIALTLAILSILDAAEPEQTTFDNNSADPVKEKGNRLLGIMSYPSENGDDDTAFRITRSVGVNAIVLGYSWPEVEVAPGEFDFSELEKHNTIYAAEDLSVILMLNPIETDWISVPPDLEQVPFDDPKMIARYQELMRNVFDHLSDLKIETLLIGNEVNSYLQDHDKWDDYTRFYEAVGSYARDLRPGIKVGVETMFEGMLQEYPDKIRELNQSSDLLALTYYPSERSLVRFPRPDLTAIERDITDLTMTYPDTKIFIIETGYPSSASVNSSEEEQANFVMETFRVWDEHAAQLEFVNFFMLHDFSETYIQAIYKELEVDEHPFFREIFEATITLGLRKYPGMGEDKLAFTVLKKEAEARGW